MTLPTGTCGDTLQPGTSGLSGRDTAFPRTCRSGLRGTSTRAVGGTQRPLSKTFFLHCQSRHPELPKMPTYLFPPVFLLSCWLAAVRSSVAGASPLLWVFFSGGACLFLPLPSMGWYTHWSAYDVANWVAVGVMGGRRPCPGRVRRVVYVHAWAGGPSCQGTIWFCPLGDCASRFREVMG